MYWEYKIINQPDSAGPLTEQTLTRFGEEGWELTSVFPAKVQKGSMQGQPSHSYIFKRLRKPT